MPRSTHPFRAKDKSARRSPFGTQMHFWIKHKRIWMKYTFTNGGEVIASFDPYEEDRKDEKIPWSRPAMIKKLTDITKKRKLLETVVIADSVFRARDHGLPAGASQLRQILDTVGYRPYQDAFTHAHRAQLEAKRTAALEKRE